MEVRELRVGDVVPRDDGLHVVVEAGLVRELAEPGAVSVQSIATVPLVTPEPGSILSWEATLDDGTVIDSTTADSIERAHELGRVVRIVARVDGQPAPIVIVACAGERLRMVTRRAVVGVGDPRARLVCMPMFELARADGSFVRLCVHPEHGLVLSTMDLNL